MFRNKIDNLLKEKIQLEEKIRENLKYAIQGRNFEKAEELTKDLSRFLSKVKNVSFNIDAEINSLWEDDISCGTFPEGMNDIILDFRMHLKEKKDMQILNQRER